MQMHWNPRYLWPQLPMPSSSPTCAHWISPHGSAMLILSSATGVSHRNFCRDTCNPKRSVCHFGPFQACGSRLARHSPRCLHLSLPLVPPYPNLQGGLVPEFINPKYTDATKTAFKKPTRLECMMQDFPKLLPAEVCLNCPQCGVNAGATYPGSQYAPFSTGHEEHLLARLYPYLCLY